jgi:hypothetical protein
LSGLPCRRRDTAQAIVRGRDYRSDMNRTAKLIVAIILLFLLIGLLPTWPYSSGWGYGYYPSGIVGLLLIVLVLLLVLGDKRGP